MNWHIGQRVVCVRDDFDSAYCGLDLPIKGRAYTVRKTLLFPFREEEAVAILLSEIINDDELFIDDNEIPIGYGEHPFWAGRFRPVVIPEADIAQFEAILRGVEKRRLVDA